MADDSSPRSSIVAPLEAKLLASTSAVAPLEAKLLASTSAVAPLEAKLLASTSARRSLHRSLLLWLAAPALFGAGCAGIFEESPRNAPNPAAAVQQGPGPGGLPYASAPDPRWQGAPGPEEHDHGDPGFPGGHPGAGFPGGHPGAGYPGGPPGAGFPGGPGGHGFPGEGQPGAADHPRARALGQLLGGAMEIKVVVRPAHNVSTAASSDRGAFYNPAFMAHLESRFGASAVAGVLAHELGHIKRGHVKVKKGITPSWLHARELEADIEAGCALAKLRMDIRGFVAATQQLAGAGSDSHPAGWRRKQAIERGFRTCSGGGDLARGQILPDPSGVTVTAHGLQRAPLPTASQPHSLGEALEPYRP